MLPKNNKHLPPPVQNYPNPVSTSDLRVHAALHFTGTPYRRGRARHAIDHNGRAAKRQVRNSIILIQPRLQAARAPIYRLETERGWAKSGK